MLAKGFPQLFRKGSDLLVVRRSYELGTQIPDLIFHVHGKPRGPGDEVVLRRGGERILRPQPPRLLYRILGILN